ncbi:MAG: DNA polymerase III subunit gamma/tau [Candidatus Saccharibacteria bacterium]|nr:DNA polymerase III subunit gamma/tau [Candidatus Saccharibacteria bacterium]
MSQALYRKYRSRSLDEVLGQDHITGILRRALAQGKIAHAYLLTGPRGVGKTSIARILAHEINQLPYGDDATHLDIIEIDAASNNGVDDIRALRDKAHIAPVSAAKKVYIIDEVHMLSKPAFNALLKTLEEPPAHVVFILATTDADKLPATIISRVQQFYFRPIAPSIMAEHLQAIAAKEGFAVSGEAAALIAEQSRGGFRDAISLLDQLSPLASKKVPLSREQVAAHLGLSGDEALLSLVAAWRASDAVAAVTILRELEGAGADPVVVAGQLLGLLRQQLHSDPSNIHLIRQLIEVSRHPHPDLKLMTIFVDAPAVQHTQPTARTATSNEPKSGATATTPPPTEAVEHSRVADAPAERSRSISSGDVSEKCTLEEGGAVAAGGKKAPSKQPSAPAKKKPTKKAKPSAAPLDWPTVLSEAKAASAGLHSLLAKCGYVQEGNSLTIYAGTKFAAKKLEDGKFRSLLSGIIATMAPDSELEFRGEQKPLEDEKLAKIAEMMGGGEEVKLEDMP